MQIYCYKERSRSGRFETIYTCIFGTYLALTALLRDL